MYKSKSQYPISLVKVFAVTLTFTLCSYFAPNANARLKPLELPKGCHKEGFTFHHQVLTLLPAKAGSHDSVYFIYNNSNQTINLYQLKDANHHMGLSINNKIRPHKWGVYSSDEDQVRFACSVPDSRFDHGLLVDCKQKLNVCEYTSVKYGLNNRGNYWMARSTSKNGAIKQSIRVGVLLSTE